MAAVTGRAGRGRAATRDGLIAAGALALGVWLGISVGLATRAKRPTPGP